MKNQILTQQNTQKELERLAAQRELYNSAKRLFGFQAILTVVLPVTLACVALLYDPSAPYVALYGVFIFAVDLLFLDPKIKHKKLKAAKIQEMFDCSVFQLSFSPLKTVSDIGVEEVLQNYEAHQKIKSNIEKIKDWYPKPVGQVDLPIARIICQRSSCWWDKKLRDNYCDKIKYILCAIIAIIVAGCFFAKTNTVHLVLILGTLIPFFQFAIKQYNDNIDMNCRLEQLSNYIDQVWAKILSGVFTNEELTTDSRRIQDGLYDNRTMSPLIFNFFYRKSRTKNEMTMTKAAQILVDEFTAATITL